MTDEHLPDDHGHHAEDAAGDPPRRDDGLDLARDLTRATAGAASPGRGGRRNTDRPWGVARRDGPRRGPVSGAHPDDRDPQPLSGEISRLVDDRGWELDLRIRGVFARWPELVGAEVADHCTPESFSDGRLVVRTDSTAWATQLRLLVPTVLRRLAADLGDGTVTVIEVQGPRAPSWSKGRRSARGGRGPRDTYG